MSNEYKNAQASLLKWAGDLVRRNAFYSQPGTPEPKIVDFDSINDEAEIPAGDIYGLADYHIENDNDTFTITTRIGVSTAGDNNSFRKRDLVNALFDAARPNAMVTVYDAESGRQLGKMKFMNGTATLPVVTTKVRTYTYIAVTLSYAVPKP